MIADKMPTQFTNSPLFEAVFEVRFSPEASLSSRALGFILQEMQVSTGRTPVFEAREGLQIPTELKVHDQNLYYVPCYRLALDDVTVIISDGSIAISQDKIYFPYQGWIKFKEHIHAIILIIEKFKSIDLFERCSLKYVDLIENKFNEEGLSLLNFQASLGNTDLSTTTFELKFEEKIKDHVSLITQLLSKVKVDVGVNKLVHSDRHDVNSRVGLLFSTDAICAFSEYAKAFDKANIFDEFKLLLEELHDQNKEKFFLALKDSTRQYLGAKYE